ncbi:HAMP domain-containing histidine kinase [Metabacillus litoralis]|uniref:histidine kinase n=1 Tax=Metabacillus litoralis TaxID=152268 RepID=A0A5C6W3T7_9BACI|nr:HAMP domain-containing sensor histidine kinase [Metabacillus litoralis]TXC90466.1 HAMP domain-containing histidine kinase [Metabacillus litoralis]
MKFDKVTILLSFQWIVMTVLFIMFKDVKAYSILLFLIVNVISVTLLNNHLKFRKRLSELNVELTRAKKGHFHTRLLANDDHLVNDIIFSLNELIEQLENLHSDKIKSEAARKSLLSSISHDIRTPLTSIIGYIDAIKDDIATTQTEKEEYIEIVSKKSIQLKCLIEELFNLAKLDADELPMNFEQVDFAEITREILIEFLPQLKNLGIKIEVEIPDSACTITADQFSVVRILENLIKNAIQYGQQGKVLGVTLFDVDCEYQLTVWDKGPGLSKEDLEHVFEKMYRVDSSRNLSSGGSGLGLAIAKSLTEKNNGRIWVKSTPFFLTSFTIALPKSESYTIKK